MSDSGSVDGFKFYNELRGKNISDSLGKGLLIQRGEGENRRVFRLTNLNAFIHGKVDTDGLWDDSKIETVLKALKVFSDKQQELEGSEGKVKELAFNLSNDKEASNISYNLNGKVTRVDVDETFKSGVDEAHNVMIKTLTRLGPEFNAFITKDLNEGQLPEDLFKTFTARFGEGKGLLSELELQNITLDNIHSFILTNLECAKDLKRHYKEKMKTTANKYAKEVLEFYYLESPSRADIKKAKELIGKIDNMCSQGGSDLLRSYYKEDIEVVRRSLGIERPDTARGAGTRVNFKLNPVPKLDLRSSGNRGIGFGEEGEFSDNVSDLTASPRSSTTENDEDEDEDPFSSPSSSTEFSNPDANGDDNYSEASTPRLYMPGLSPRSFDEPDNDDESGSSFGGPPHLSPLGTHHQTMGPMRSNLFTNSNLSTIPEGDENEDEDSVNSEDSEDSEVKTHIPFSAGSSSLETHEHSSTNLDGSEVPESVFTFPRRGESSEAPTIQRPEKEAQVLEEAFQSLIDEPHEYLYNKSDFSKAKLEEVFKWLDDLVGEGRIFKKRDLIKAMVKEPLLAFYVLEHISKIKEDKENFFTAGEGENVLKNASSIAEKVDANRFVDVIERFGPDDSYYSQLADTQAYSQTLHSLFKKHKKQLKDIVAKGQEDIVGEPPNNITRTRFILHRAELYHREYDFGVKSSFEFINQMRDIEEKLDKNPSDKDKLLENLADRFEDVLRRVSHKEKHTLDYLQKVSVRLKEEYTKKFPDDKGCEGLKTLRKTWQRAIVFSYNGEDHHPALDYIKIATQTDYLTLARKENELTKLSNSINHLQGLIEKAKGQNPIPETKISSLEKKKKEAVDQFERDFKELCENPEDKEAEFFKTLKGILDSIKIIAPGEKQEKVFLLTKVCEDAKKQAGQKSALAGASYIFMLYCKKFTDNDEGFKSFLQAIDGDDKGLEAHGLYSSYHFSGMHQPSSEGDLEHYDLVPLEAMRKSTNPLIAKLYRGLVVEKLINTNYPVIEASKVERDTLPQHILTLEKQGQILFHSFDKDDFLHLFKSLEREIQNKERYSFVFGKLKELYFPPSSIDLLYEALKEGKILDAIEACNFLQDEEEGLEDNYVVRLLKEKLRRYAEEESPTAESVIKAVAKGLKEEEYDGIRFGALIHHNKIKEELERFKEDLRKVGVPQVSSKGGAIRKSRVAISERRGAVDKVKEVPKTEEEVWKDFLDNLKELEEPSTGVPVTENHPMRLEAEIFYLDSLLEKIQNEVTRVVKNPEDTRTPEQKTQQILNDMDAWKYLDRLKEIQEDLLIREEIRKKAKDINNDFKEKFNLQ